jgi:hypothetical protein
VSRRILATAAAATLLACATSQKDHSALMAAQVRSILVVPVMNRSVDVTAPDYFLSTVPVPIAERGYYVFPVNLVKRLLEDDGLADPGLVHAADTARLASIFGADAVLYVTIERWDARWILLSTKVTVEFSYVLRDGKTGATLWAEHQTIQYQSNDGGGGLIGAVINAAVTRAAPNYMPLARQANAKALAYPGPGFPAGPHHPLHGNDWSPPGGVVAVAPTPAAPATTAPVPNAATPSAAAERKPELVPASK